MRIVLLFVLGLLVGCGQELSEKPEIADAYAAENTRFALETDSRVDWWIESSLTIDAQTALRTQPNTPKFFSGFISDVVEIEGVIYILASPVSDAPEATYLLRVSEEQLMKLRQDASEDSLAWFNIRCALTIDRLRYYPLAVEGEPLSESGWVNFVDRGSLIVFGKCSAIELYD